MVAGTDEGDRIVKEKPEVDGSPVATLTYDNFEHGTKKGYVFVKFFVPW